MQKAQDIYTPCIEDVIASISNYHTSSRHKLNHYRPVSKRAKTGKKLDDSNKTKPKYQWIDLTPLEDRLSTGNQNLKISKSNEL